LAHRKIDREKKMTDRRVKEGEELQTKKRETEGR